LNGEEVRPIKNLLVKFVRKPTALVEELNGMKALVAKIIWNSRICQKKISHFSNL